MSYRHHIGPIKAKQLYTALAALVEEIETRCIRTDCANRLVAHDETLIANAQAALDSITEEEAAGGGA